MAPSNATFRAVWRIPLIYAALAALWILFSDAAVRLLAQDAAALSRMQTSKGWFFVACTALLLAALLAREYRVLLAHQRQLEHLNRLYAVLSQVNQSIVREEDRGRLFQEICRIALEFGGFRLAWIGGVAGVEGGLTVLAAAGAAPAVLGRPGGPGCPAGQAVEQGGVRLIHDLAAAEAFSWRETAQALGCRSLVSVPALVRGRTAVVLTLCAPERDFFQEREAALAEEVALDIGFALEAMERRRLHEEAEEALRGSLRQKDLLLREVHHRVKNNLQLVQSLLRLQADRYESPADRRMLEESQVRVQTLSRVHDVLSRSGDVTRICMRTYLRELVQGLARHHDPAGRVRLDLPEEEGVLGLDQAAPCGLLAGELASNALRHAFPHGQGVLRVEFSTRDGQARLRVCDNGQGLPPGLDPGDPTSLGLVLIQALSEQLGGAPRWDQSQGLDFELRFPVRPEDSPRIQD